MNRRQDQIVPVEERIGCEIAERFGRVEREITEETLSRGVIPRETLERLEVRDSNSACFVQPLEVRFVPLANHPELSRPLSCRAECTQQRAETDVPFPLPAFPVAEYAARLNRPHTGQQLQHPKSRDVVARILGPTQNADDVLHVRCFEELEPAVLHE